MSPLQSDLSLKTHLQDWSSHHRFHTATEEQLNVFLNQTRIKWTQVTMLVIDPENITQSHTLFIEFFIDYKLLFFSFFFFDLCIETTRGDPPMLYKITLGAHKSQMSMDPTPLHITHTSL